MSPEDRRTLRVGLVGFVVAVALILAAWRVVASDLPDFHAAAALPATPPTSEPPASRTPSETFAVPSPPPVTTPTETPSPAPADSEVVEPPLSTTAPAVALPPPQAAARGATPSHTQPSLSPSPAPAQVRGVDLNCAQHGKRVAATLSFVSGGPVAVSVTAGGRTENSRGGGAVRMHVSGPGDPGASCAAVVDGRPVGPVSGGRRR